MLIVLAVGRDRWLPPTTRNGNDVRWVNVIVTSHTHSYSNKLIQRVHIPSTIGLTENESAAMRVQHTHIRKREGSLEPLPPTSWRYTYAYECSSLARQDVWESSAMRDWETSAFDRQVHTCLALALYLYQLPPLTHNFYTSSFFYLNTIRTYMYVAAHNRQLFYTLAHSVEKVFKDSRSVAPSRAYVGLPLARRVQCERSFSHKYRVFIINHGSNCYNVINFKT